MEEQILNFWTENNIYNKILEKNKNGSDFNFMDGPPFVSSDNLHYGHLLVSSIKSATLNYKQMNGYNVKNKIGFDCHGLPIEMLVNKLLNIENNTDIVNYGVDKYNSLCKETINKYSLSWKPIYERIGRFVDYNNTYKTMDTNYMESVWKITQLLWNKDLIITSNKIMAVSPKCGTVLSNFEASQNYKDVVDPSVYFKIKYNDTYLIVWTTTPWTLPANICLCVNHNIDYVKILDKKTNEYYILGKFAINNLYKNQNDYQIIEEFKGKALKGKHYEPLFDYYKKSAKLNQPYRILCDNYVTSTSGTGIVHLAPAFGEDDCRVCVRENIIKSCDLNDVCPITDNGIFCNLNDDLDGKYFQDANNLIISRLKNDGMLIKKEMYKHSYPFCWRTDVPLIYKPVSGYFVAVSKIKDDLINNNGQINWVPDFVGNNRFNNWISNSVDWCISRSRFFGTPIPVWVSDDGQEKICIGSIAELKQLANITQDITDIHMEFIDNILIPSQMGKGMLKRIPFVFDCWFESGCVPYAQNGLLDNNKEYIADFICEGIDQTRGWFYTLLVLSTALYNQPPTKNILCSGLILASDGKKMSKKDGNYIKPQELFNKYGGDAIRLYLIGSPAAKADSFKFNQDNIEIISKKLYQLCNCYNFFEENYNKFIIVNKFVKNNKLINNNVFDKWIISRLADLINIINKCMGNYDINKIPNELLKFIEDFTNVYLKFNRNVIKGNCTKEETNNVLNIIATVIVSFCRIAAPFMPFTCEHLYKKINSINFASNESVHLEQYPIANDFPMCENTLDKFNKLQTIIDIIRSLRARSKNMTCNKIPINSVNIYVASNVLDQWIIQLNDMTNLLKNEMNIIDITINDISSMIKYVVKPNNKTIGQKYKGNANVFKTELLKIDPNVLYNMKQNNVFEHISINNNMVQICGDDYDIGVELNYELGTDESYVMENNILVVGNFQYTDLIKYMYLKNVFVRKIQKLRRSMKLKPWNKIVVYYNLYNNNDIKYMFEKYMDGIQSHVNCTLIEKDNQETIDGVRQYIVLDHRISEEKIDQFDGIDNKLLITITNV